jgi:hypothetical protein
MVMTDKLRPVRDKRLYCIIWQRGIFTVLCFTLLSVAGMAQEQGSISGIMQLNGEGIPNHRIMLIRFTQAGEVHRIPGQTDAAGQFTFENLDTGEEFEYFVGIRYTGQLYRSTPIRLASGQHRTGVVVEVGVSTGPMAEEALAPPPFLVTNHLIVLVLRDQHLEVREVVRLLSNQPALSPSLETQPHLGQNLLHLPLPQGYYNFVGIQGFIPEHVRLLVSGLQYTASLEVGEHRLVYAYSLPLHSEVLTILTERTLPTTVLDILIEDEQLVAISDLQPMERVSIKPHTFWHFRGTDLPVQARSWFQVTRRNAPASFLQVGAYIVVVGITLFGIGLPLYEVWHKRRQQRLDSIGLVGKLEVLNMARLRLLQTVARLDDQYQGGTIEARVYQQRRDEYKQQLLDLAQQLRHAPSDKEISGEAH